MNLDDLIGQKLIKYEINQSDYYGIGEKTHKNISNVTLKFSNAVVVIDNPIQLSVDNKTMTLKNESITLLNNFTNEELNHIINLPNISLTLEFKNNKFLRISLKEEDFLSPEAMSFNFENGDIIVIN